MRNIRAHLVPPHGADWIVGHRHCVSRVWFIKYIHGRVASVIQTRETLSGEGDLDTGSSSRQTCQSRDKRHIDTNTHHTLQ